MRRESNPFTIFLLPHRIKPIQDVGGQMTDPRPDRQSSCLLPIPNKLGGMIPTKINYKVTHEGLLNFMWIEEQVIKGMKLIDRIKFFCSYCVNKQAPFNESDIGMEYFRVNW